MLAKRLGLVFLAGIFTYFAINFVLFVFGLPTLHEWIGWK